MLASILNTPTAVQASVHVVRAFVRLREVLATHKGLGRKLEELEKKYDAQFKAAALNRVSGRGGEAALSDETTEPTSRA
jgi:hypothetical protein